MVPFLACERRSTHVQKGDSATNAPRAPIESCTGSMCGWEHGSTPKATSFEKSLFGSDKVLALSSFSIRSSSNPPATQPSLSLVAYLSGEMKEDRVKLTACTCPAAGSQAKGRPCFWHAGFSLPVLLDVCERARVFSPEAGCAVILVSSVHGVLRSSISSLGDGNGFHSPNVYDARSSCNSDYSLSLSLSPAHPTHNHAYSSPFHSHRRRCQCTTAVTPTTSTKNLAPCNPVHTAQTSQICHFFALRPSHLSRSAKTWSERWLVALPEPTQILANLKRFCIFGLKKRAVCTG